MQQQNNTQLTKITADLPLATLLDFSPSQEPNNAAAFPTILSAAKFRKSHSNQTGKFPAQQSCIRQASSRHNSLAVATAS
jgi:hypothetical protein